MNIENGKEALRLLAEQPDEKFDMDLYFKQVGSTEVFCNVLSITGAEQAWKAHACNTVCCLAGLIQMHKAVTDEERSKRAYHFALHWLDIDFETANWLFLPDEYRWGTVLPIPKETVAERVQWLIDFEEATAENNWRDHVYTQEFLTTLDAEAEALSALSVITDVGDEP